MFSPGSCELFFPPGVLHQASVVDSMGDFKGPMSVGEQALSTTRALQI